MSRQPRFEIVRTNAEQPWHARFRAANGRVVWVTETYTRRRAAVEAVLTILDGGEWAIDTINGGIITHQVDERD